MMETFHDVLGGESCLSAPDFHQHLEGEVIVGVLLEALHVYVAPRERGDEVRDGSWAPGSRGLEGGQWKCTFALWKEEDAPDEVEPFCFFFSCASW